MNPLNIELNESWLTGKYTVNGYKVEINTAFSVIAIGDFFAQDNEADDINSKIHQYWLNNNCTMTEAIEWFIYAHLDISEL